MTTATHTYTHIFTFNVVKTTKVTNDGLYIILPMCTGGREGDRLG